MNTKLLINGKLVETREKQRVINPSDGKVICEVSLAGQKEALAALEAARSSHDQGQWPRLPLSERKKLLLKVSQGILDNAAELSGLETANTGKPIKESTFMDIPSAAKTFEYFAQNLEELSRPQTIDINAQTGNARAKLTREPYGVAVLIVPWNYPLLIASWKMAQALAAGNSVILKPSGLTPLTALALAGIIKEAGFPEGAVNVLNGSGKTIGECLCTDKRTDMISFTGGNEVGRQILGYSQKYVKKLVMELGGKSAAIVLQDADLETAVNGCLCSVFLNQGQMCTAMSRILVQESIYGQFLNDFLSKVRRIKLGKGEDFESQMGPLISDEQRGKILDFVEQAQQEGAQLLCGGKVPQQEGLQEGFFFEPAVFGAVLPAMRIFREEVFGPVAALCSFKTEDEALELANGSDFGLAASIWTKDPKKADEMSSRINAGLIWVNNYGMFHNEVPYGGFKQSGFGKELGRQGFNEYSRLKSCLKNASEEKPLVNYWYGF